MRKINRTKLLDRKHDRRSAKLFVIATEGKDTEKQYFEMFGSRKVKVEILATGDDNKSAPEYVLERLDKFKDLYDFNEEDEFWLVIDVDRWRKQLITVCRQANQKGYQLAISNPCFEIWLCLHFRDLHPTDKTCKHFEARLKADLGGYNKSNLDIFAYQPNVESAIKRSRNLDLNLKGSWTSELGTRVYKLVESILQSLND
ncbi:RloB domain-containing protein [Pseudanabaena sp. FACHB-1998]|uniref:RloB family protein n=1 Tax=Pseudanabaena sp. FACHB-1998 TaxID=2692858 RepID=UPI001681B7EC|nr:RloB family protein [Pseudanabaena sp. FACHB-1998]MBD2175450.1 RloB domain-containing protein [Pseudanabaena sp. FACHB-1998]